MKFDINIISMPDSHRRNRFNSFTYPFDFFNAYSSPVNFDVKKATEYYGRDIRKGEIGCTTSHYELYKKLKKNSSYNWHLILEDDASIEKEFQSLCNNFDMLSAEIRPMILILGHSKTVKKFQWVQKLKQPMKTELQIGSHQFGKKYVNLVGTVSYMINNSAIDTILQHTPYWLADDWGLIEEMGINVLHIKDNLVYEEFDGISLTDNQLFVQHDIKNQPAKTILKIILNQLYFFTGIKKRYY